MTKTPWPPLHAYALAHPCPTCHAHPGDPCNAPNKTARLNRARRLAAQTGSTFNPDPIASMHKTRQRAGARHHMHDVENAPWSEDRIPGKRYDTLTHDQTEETE